MLQQLIAETPTMRTGIESELASLPHLQTDQRIVLQRGGATYSEMLKATCAAELLQALPKPRESVHLVIGGRFALADLVPAVLSLAKPAKIKSLDIATLGFSKRNIAMLCRLLDSGDIGRLRILCSHYFKHTSKDIYETAREELSKRKPRTEFATARTHAKIFNMELTDRRFVVSESSANARSCKNIENISIFGDPRLHEFHVRWMDALFFQPNRKGNQNGKVKGKAQR